MSNMGIHKEPEEPVFAGDVAVAERTTTKLKKPRGYRVLLHNDDFTAMEFVVMVLETVFHHNETDAARIMLHVHQQGVGVAGVFSHEVAETKVNQVMDLARENQHPLQCTIEKDGDDDGDK